jgi:opacity protein-like surface antigen
MSVKKIIIVGMLVSVAGVANAVRDQKTGFYGQANLGYSRSTKSKLEFTIKKETNAKSYQAVNGKAGESLMIGMEIGKKINNNIRVALDIGYRAGYNDAKAYTVRYDVKEADDCGDMKLKSLAFIPTLYWDVVNFKGFVPYGLVGLGLAQNKLKVKGSGVQYQTSSEQTNSFAYKLGLGGRYILNKDIDLDFRYQYVNLGKAKLGSTVSYPDYSASSVDTTKEWKLRVHEFMMGAAYKF